MADGNAHCCRYPERRLRRSFHCPTRYLANLDLPKRFMAGENGPAPGKACTCCNKCLVNVIELPIGCFEEARFTEYGDAAYDRMIEEAFAYYQDDVPTTPSVVMAGRA
jgi:hypothetical protein